MARFSFTPATLQASIWQMPIAPAREQLLEHHPVCYVLTRGHLDRRHRARDRDVTKDVVWARGFLDPVQVEL